MAAPTTHFLKVSLEESKKLVARSGEWKNLHFKTAQGDLTPITLSNSGEGYLTIEGGPAAETQGSVHFYLGDTIYFAEGKLLDKQFTWTMFYREQKRKLVRLDVPANYPAGFKLKSVNALEKNSDGRVLDLHADGLRLVFSADLGLKSGDRIAGVLTLNKFPPVEIAGTVRHCAKDPEAFGVEANHLEFASEDKMRELMLFFRADVFYFNKK